MYFLWITLASIVSVSSVSINISEPIESIPSIELSLETINSINVQNLHDAMNFSVPNAKFVILILTSTTVEERKQFEQIYQTKYEKSLVLDLKNAFSGKLQEALVALMMPQEEFYAQEINEAIHSTNPLENALIDSLCIFDYPLLHKIYEIYPNYSNGILFEDDLKVLQPKQFQTLMNLCYLKSENSTMKQYDIDDLDSIKSLTEEQFFEFMSLHDCKTILQFSLIYKNITGKKIEDVVQQKYEGKLQRALMAILKYSQSETHYFATRLHESLSGPEVDYKSLLHLLLMNRTVSFQNIYHYYRRLYRENLADTIDREIPSAHYRFLLANLLTKKKSSTVPNEQELL